MEGSKFNQESIKHIGVHLYVVHGMKKNPAKTLKFIMENKKYFPDIDLDTIKKVMKENGITDEDIEKEESVNMDDLTL